MGSAFAINSNLEITIVGDKLICKSKLTGFQYPYRIKNNVFEVSICQNWYPANRENFVFDEEEE